MKTKENICLVALIFWFTLDITGFSIGKFCLVESLGIRSIDTLWWAIFMVLSILYFLKGKIWNWVLTGFVTLWIFIQYTSHWHYTLFGVSQKKLLSYNKFFEKTYHIVPSSNSVLVPDLYHIILHILLIFTIIELIKRTKLSKKVV